MAGVSPSEGLWQSGGGGTAARADHRGVILRGLPQPGLEPEPDGALGLRPKPGDAVLDGYAFSAATFDDMARGYAQLRGKLFDLDTSCGHVKPVSAVARLQYS